MSVNIYVYRILLQWFLIVPFNKASLNLPLWNWECINDKCVPSKASEEKCQSLETCNMLCASMQLWPQPTGSVSLSTTAVPVRVDLIQLQIKSCTSTSVREHLLDAFEVTKNNLRKMERGARGFQEWRSMAVRVTVKSDADSRMLLTTDESYSLSLRPKKGSISLLLVDILAQSFCGARHAFETLSQLIWLDSYEGTLLVLEAAKIEDAPKFSYRGLMLDTASNYFPLVDILRTIDAMATSKMNTFHWHVSGSQSFSLFLNSVPQLAQYGAYGPGAIYTPEEVRLVVHHARVRGIRVLLEVDAPAHVGRAWIWGSEAQLGTLVHCLDAEPWFAYCSEPPCGQLNPRNPNVYDILERIYAEIYQLTDRTDIFHLGGDVISELCWNEHFNGTKPMELWLEFTRKALERLESTRGHLPNLTILWTSDLNEKIKIDLKDYVHVIGIQARSVAWAYKYITGIRTIISHEDVWDLNSGTGLWYEGSDGSPYNSWQRIYEHRPWARHPSWIVEGGEATVWSSSVSAGSLDGHVWPRAAALAERLWTDRAEGATRPVHARLDVHRSRLLKRGIQVTPLWSMWCTQNPYTCG